MTQPSSKRLLTEASGVSQFVPTGGDDTPTLQALIDGGARKIVCKPGSTFQILTPLFLDSTSRTYQVVLDLAGSTLQLGGSLPTVAEWSTAGNAFCPQTLTSTATGGTFTLTAGGSTTAALAYNATAAQVQAALAAISATAASMCAGGPLPTTGISILTPNPAGGLTVNTGSLTGGTASITSVVPTRWAIFPNTTRSALSGGVVTMTGHTAHAAPVSRLSISNGVVDGQGTNVGLVFGNTCVAELDNITMTGARALLTWVGYIDAAHIRKCVNISPYGGAGGDSFLLYGIKAGDGIVASGLSTDSTGGTVALGSNLGAVIDATVSGVMRFLFCHAVHIRSSHQEADQANLFPSITVNASKIIVDGGFHQAGRKAGAYSIVVNDTGSDHTELLLRDINLQLLNRTTDGDLAAQPGIYVQSMYQHSKIRAQGLHGTIDVGGAGVQHGTYTVRSAVTAIDNALTTNIATALYARGNWELRYRAGSWEVIDPNTPGLLITRKLNAPTGLALSATANSLTGSLTNGTVYEYAAACMDALGNYGPAGTAVSATAGSNGAMRLLLTVTTSPCNLVIWRKAGTGVLSAPDAYISIPWDGNSSRILDTGTYLDGLPWITSSVPVPTTVAASDHSRDGLFFTDPLITAGSTGLFPQLLITQPSDTSRIGTTTVVTASGLTATVEANATYSFEAFLKYDASASGRFKFGWTAPSGITALDWTPNCLDPAVTTGTIGGIDRSYLTSAATASAGAYGVGNFVVATPSGRLVTGASGGSFALQFAQVTSDGANSTSLRTGSWLRLIRTA